MIVSWHRKMRKTPNKHPPKGLTLAQRLDFYTLPPNETGCRICTLTQLKGGYAMINTGVLDGRKMKGAHIIALELKLGRRLKPGMQANHTCDTPNCVEWDHLYEGTQLQNVKDRIKRGRSARLRADSNGHAKFTWRDIRRMRALKGRMSQRKIAVLFSTTQSHVQRILSGICWADNV